MSFQTRRFAAEFIGTGLLLATVVGSGIMAERLAGGNVAIALLANSVATGAILIVLITMFGPVSGAHFNPAVTLVMALRKGIARRPQRGFSWHCRSPAPSQASGSRTRCSRSR